MVEDESAPRPVVLGDTTAEAADTARALHDLAGAAHAARDDLEGAVALARDAGAAWPTPGSGSTTRLWESLATVAASDLSVARAVEPHVDALAILAEAGRPRPGGDTFWGVYAAEGPGVRLEARPDGDRWQLTGVKPWCSLADRATHALVTAWVDDDRRGLFAVDLRGSGVETLDGPWVARGLRPIRSGAVSFEAVPADPVGEPGWYLRRSGFAWGGIGVAAVWYGGAVGVARRLSTQARRRDPDQIALMHLGIADLALTAARSILRQAAEAVDAGRADGAEGALLALRVRGVVADAVDRIVRTSDHALGPGPLTQEEDHARRVADLRVYVRQHHAERDAAALGSAVLDRAGDTAPW